MAAGSGAGRGPGGAEMTFGDESSIDPSLFESNVLDGAAVVDPSHSALLSTDLVAPEVDVQGEASGLGSIQTATGAATWKRRLAPHQRAAVRRFFTPPDDQ